MIDVSTHANPRAGGVRTEPHTQCKLPARMSERRECAARARAPLHSPAVGREIV